MQGMFGDTLTHTTPPPQVQMVRDWKVQGQELAQQGNESIDACLALAIRNCDNFHLRVETLQEWGIANAETQIRNYAIFLELDDNDPLRKLTNSQRNALLSPPEQFHPELMQRARDLLESGRPAGRISEAWANAQVGMLKAELKGLARDSQARLGQMTPNVRLAMTEQKVQQLEAEVSRLLQENAELIQLVDAMNTNALEVAA